MTVLPAYYCQWCHGFYTAEKCPCTVPKTFVCFCILADFAARVEEILKIS